MLGDIDLRVYDHNLQINFEIRSGWMIFDQLTAVGLCNLAKYSVVTTLFHYDFRYWLDFLVWECIIISYRSTLKFILVEWFLANLQTFGLLLRELKKGETFASLLNIHGGDIRVVPTHLVSHLFDHSQVSISNEHSFDIGLTNTFCPSNTLATRTCPSLLGKNSRQCNSTGNNPSRAFYISSSLLLYAFYIRKLKVLLF